MEWLVEFATPHIGHLENTGFSSYEALSSVDKFHNIILKKSHSLISSPVSLEKPLNTGKLRAQKSAEYPTPNNDSLLVILSSENDIP